MTSQWKLRGRCGPAGAAEAAWRRAARRRKYPRNARNGGQNHENTPIFGEQNVNSVTTWLPNYFGAVFYFQQFAKFDCTKNSSTVRTLPSPPGGRMDFRPALAHFDETTGRDSAGSWSYCAPQRGYFRQSGLPVRLRAALDGSEVGGMRGRPGGRRSWMRMGR